MSRLSLRARVTAVAALAVALVLVVAGIVTVVTLRHQLVEDVDDTAATVAAELAEGLDRDPAPPSLLVRGDDDTVAQLLGPAGEVRSATTNLEGEPAIATERGIHTMGELPHDEARFRILVRPVDQGTLVVGVSLEDVDETISALRRTLFVISPLVLLVLAGLVWFVVGRTMRPVERANQRQRQFVADASHELRSPLTRIRAELEVDLAHPGRAEPLATHRTVLAEAVGLQALVDDLLLLARGDADDDAARHVPVDLDDLVLAEVQRVQPTAGVALDVGRVSGGQVVGNPDHLRRVVRNLLDNAVRHARTIVSVEVREEADDTVLGIADDGPGIPVEARERVFERFARLDDARAAEAGGTGLGLAIVRDIVESHGGTVAVDAAHTSGTRMVVRLPRVR